MFGFGYRERNLKNILKLCRKVKRLFRLKFFEKLNEKQTVIIEDISDMTVGMVDFLLLDDFKTLEQYFESINAFLEFEQETFFYMTLLNYEPGNMKRISELIRLNHQIIDLKKTFH